MDFGLGIPPGDVAHRGDGLLLRRLRVDSLEPVSHGLLRPSRGQPPRSRRHGHDVAVLPGLVPESEQGLAPKLTRVGAAMPTPAANALSSHTHHPDAHQHLGCRQLVRAGASLDPIGRQRPDSGLVCRSIVLHCPLAVSRTEHKTGLGSRFGHGRFGGVGRSIVAPECHKRLGRLDTALSLALSCPTRAHPAHYARGPFPLPLYRLSRLFVSTGLDSTASRYTGSPLA